MYSFQKTNLTRLLTLLQPHAWLMGIATVAGLARLLVPVFMPWGIKVIIDDILRNPVDTFSFKQLHLITLSLVVIVLIWSIFNFARLYLSGIAGNRAVFDLRHHLFMHFQKMSVDFFQKKRVGEIVSRLTQDVSKAEDLISFLLPITLMEIITILAIAVIMLIVHFQLALICLIILPIYAIVSHRFAQKIKNISKKVQERLAEMTGVIHERFNGHSVVLTYSREAYEETKYLNGAKEHYVAADQNFRHQAFGIAVTGFLTSFAPIVVIWYGSVCVLNATLTVGELVAFYAYVGMLYNPVSRLTEMYVTSAQSIAATDRIFEAMSYEPEIKEDARAVHLHNVNGNIKFSNVVFSYSKISDKQHNVLKNFNLEIKAGECVLLHGPSGSGKSTIAKLILRFYDSQQGVITLDGVNIRHITFSSLRDHIGYVSQEPILFSGTILDNILYGETSATREDAVRAAKWSNAHDFIMSLPETYDSQVGEGGVKLSVGQKQRVAIARALLKNPDVLILDEPTSAIDEVSSLIIQENMKRLRRGKTTLWITHQSSSKDFADRILYLSKNGLHDYSADIDLRRF